MSEITSNMCTCIRQQLSTRQCQECSGLIYSLPSITDALGQLTRKYELLAVAVNDDCDHCDDDCDSIAHSDACNQAGTELVIRQQERIGQLEAERDKEGKNAFEKGLLLEAHRQTKERQDKRIGQLEADIRQIHWVVGDESVPENIKREVCDLCNKLLEIAGESGK